MKFETKRRGKLFKILSYYIRIQTSPIILYNKYPRETVQKKKKTCPNLRDNSLKQSLSSKLGKTPLLAVTNNKLPSSSLPAE